MLYVAIIFTLLCSFIIPILAFFLFPKYFKGTGRVIVFGVMTFIASQIILRLPLLQIIASIWPVYAEWLRKPTFLYCLFLGVTAAIFEEGTRYLVMRFILKGHRKDVDGIAFGIGHGGIEAILFVGINYVALLVMIFLKTAGSLQEIAIGDVFLAGAERFFTIFFHIAWSLMIIKSIQKKNAYGFMIALFTHAFLDTAVVYLMIKSVNIYIVELILGILTIAPITYIILTIKKDKKEKPHVFQRIGEKNGNN